MLHAHADAALFLPFDLIVITISNSEILRDRLLLSPLSAKDSALEFPSVTCYSIDCLGMSNAILDLSIRPRCINKCVRTAHAISLAIEKRLAVLESGESLGYDACNRIWLVLFSDTCSTSPLSLLVHLRYPSIKRMTSQHKTDNDTCAMLAQQETMSDEKKEFAEAYVVSSSSCPNDCISIYSDTLVRQTADASRFPDRAAVGNIETSARKNRPLRLLDHLS